MSSSSKNTSPPTKRKRNKNSKEKSCKKSKKENTANNDRQNFKRNILGRLLKWSKKDPIPTEKSVPIKSSFSNHYEKEPTLQRKAISLPLQCEPLKNGALSGTGEEEQYGKEILQPEEQGQETLEKEVEDDILPPSKKLHVEEKQEKIQFTMNIDLGLREKLVAKTENDPNFSVDLLVMPPPRTDSHITADGTEKQLEIMAPSPQSVPHQKEQQRQQPLDVKQSVDAIHEPVLPSYIRPLTLSLKVQPAVPYVPPSDLASKYGAKNLQDFCGRQDVCERFLKWLKDATDREGKYSSPADKVCFLEGPIGSGKTMLTKLAAKKVGCIVRTMDYSCPTVRDPLFESLLIVNRKPILPFVMLIENLDSILQIEKSPNKETLSFTEEESDKGTIGAIGKTKAKTKNKNGKYTIGSDVMYDIIGDWKTFLSRLHAASQPLVITSCDRKGKLLKELASHCTLIRLYPAPDSYLKTLTLSIVKTERQKARVSTTISDILFDSVQAESSIVEQKEWKHLSQMVESCEGNFVKLFSTLEFLVATDRRPGVTIFSPHHYFYDNNKQLLFDYVNQWFRRDAEIKARIYEENVDIVSTLIVGNYLGHYISRAQKYPFLPVPLEAIRFLQFMEHLHNVLYAYFIHKCDHSFDYSKWMLKLIRNHVHTANSTVQKCSWPHKMINVDQMKMKNSSKLLEFWAEHRHTEEASLVKRILRSKFAIAKGILLQYAPETVEYKKAKQYLSHWKSKEISTSHIYYLYDVSEGNSTHRFFRSKAEEEHYHLSKTEADYWVNYFFQHDISQKQSKFIPAKAKATITTAATTKTTMPRFYFKPMI